MINYKNTNKIRLRYVSMYAILSYLFIAGLIFLIKGNHIVLALEEDTEPLSGLQKFGLTLIIIVIMAYLVMKFKEFYNNRNNKIELFLVIYMLIIKFLFYLILLEPKIMPGSSGIYFKIFTFLLVVSFAVLIYFIIAHIYTLILKHMIGLNSANKMTIFISLMALVVSILSFVFK